MLDEYGCPYLESYHKYYENDSIFFISIISGLCLTLMIFLITMAMRWPVEEINPLMLLGGSALLCILSALFLCMVNIFMYFKTKYKNKKTMKTWKIKYAIAETDENRKKSVSFAQEVRKNAKSY